MLPTKAYAAKDTTSPLAPFQIERREPGQHDVLLDILYCGICHSDIHFVHRQFPGAGFPAVRDTDYRGRLSFSYSHNSCAQPHNNRGANE